MSDIDSKWHDLVYLTAMQMGLPKTIANLPSREERKEALKGMKDMVYHRVVRLFKTGETNAKR